MSTFLYRLGTLLIVGDIVYLAGAQVLTGGEANKHVFQMILGLAGACLVAGLLLAVVVRAKTGLTASTCPRCGKRVARGRVYCEDHLVEAINRYRDEQRQKGE